MAPAPPPPPRAPFAWPSPPEHRPRTLRLSWRYLSSLPARLANPPPAVGKVRSFGLTPLFQVQLEDVLNRKHLPPIGLKDFEEWLLFVEHTPQYLYFALWLKDYNRRYSAWVQRARASRPAPRPEDASPYRLVWHPDTSPSLAEFYARAKATFFAEGAEYELHGIPADLLNALRERPDSEQPLTMSQNASPGSAGPSDPPQPTPLSTLLSETPEQEWHNDLFTSPHPDPALLAPIAECVNANLRASLSRLVSAAHYNVGTARALCGAIGGTTIGLVTGLLPMLVVMFTEGSSPAEHGAHGDWDRWWGRWVRIVGFPGLWLGLTILLASLNGVCMMIYVFGDFRQLRTFELTRPEVELSQPSEEPASPANITSHTMPSTLNPASIATSSRTAVATLSTAPTVAPRDDARSESNSKSRSQSTSARSPTTDDSFFDYSSASSASSPSLHSVTSKHSVQSIRSNNSGSSTYSHPEGRIHFSRAYYDEMDPPISPVVAEASGSGAGPRQLDLDPSSPTSVGGRTIASGVPAEEDRKRPAMQTAGFIPMEDGEEEAGHGLRGMDDLESGTATAALREDERRGRGFSRRPTFGMARASARAEPVFDFDALPPRPTRAMPSTPGSPAASHNPHTRPPPLPSPETVQVEDTDTHGGTGFATFRPSSSRKPDFSLRRWFRNMAERQAEQCARSISVTHEVAGRVQFSGMADHGALVSASAPASAFASYPPLPPTYSHPHSHPENQNLNPDSNTEKCGLDEKWDGTSEKARAHWLLTRRTPAFASPLTRVRSPLVARAQWEVVVRSALLSFGLTWVFIGALLAVPVHVH